MLSVNKLNVTPSPFWGGEIVTIRGNNLLTRQLVNLFFRLAQGNSFEQVFNLQSNGHWTKGKGVPLSFAKELEWLI